MKRTYELEKVVRSYAVQDRLQKPEQTILDLLRERLGYMKMLDIGVGGGRTTLHFAPLVAEYTGIDYANNMIRACRERFAGWEENMSFRVADACSMDEFAPESFDFILFSFNGIDNVSHEDRIRILREIRRLGKPGGVFAFSTHNLRALHKIYSIPVTFHPKRLVVRIVRYLRLVFLNGLPGRHQRKSYTIVNDGAHGFGLSMYYIRPEAQIRQLEEVGFRNVRLFSVLSGEELDPARLEEVTEDKWIYYLCEM